jgi:hypothetical protein
MITGVDTVMIVAHAPGAAIIRFLDDWSTRWTSMRVTVSGARSDFAAWQDMRASVPLSEGELLIVRDATMEAAWDEHGYDIPGSPEGPFAILYEPCPAQAFSVTVTSDPYARDTRFSFESHEALAIGSGLTLVTVVAPSPGSKFSLDIIDGLTTAFSSSRD